MALAQVDRPRPTVLELLQLAAGYLDKKGVASPRREADALLGHVLEKDRLHLYLAFEERPSTTEVDLFRALMKRRGEREPLQYLVGEGNFMGLRLKLDKRALIPRPETEALAQRLRALVAAGGSGADIGTGSGCLALSLAAHGLDIQATDVSADALALASENAVMNGLQAKLRFAQGSLLQPVTGMLDLIVSNPPYIPEGTALQPEVGGFEPAQALFGGADGLSLLRPLLAEAPSKLKPGAWLALECGEGQPKLLAVDAQASGAWAQVLIEEDPFGVPRFLLTQRI
jgi:release factor glutamine methyltransferase